MKQSLKVNYSEKPNSFVLETTDGWLIETSVVDGKLFSFIYNNKKFGEESSCVAMAYDGNMLLENHRDLELDGSEEP